MIDHHFDIAVVGGGATGLAAALGCARLGRRTVLFAPPAATADGRTAALLAGSIDLLARLDVRPALQPTTAPIRRMRLVDATTRIWRAPEILFDSAEIGLDAFGYNVSDGDLIDILRRAAGRLEGLEIRNQAAVDIDLQPDRIEVAGPDGRRASAALLVAADGRHSVARATGGIHVRQWSYPQRALVAILEHESDHDDTSTEFQSDAGPFTLVPLPGRRSSLVWMDDPAAIEAAEKLPDAAFNRLVSERSDFLLGQLRLASRRSSFPMQAQLADRFGTGRMVLVGEAAHAFPPIGAQGLNLGLRDVATLLEVLESSIDHDAGTAATVAAYERRRGADIRLRTLAVDLLNRSLLSGLLPVQLARSAGFRAAGHFRAARRMLMRAGLGPTVQESRGALHGGHGERGENAL